MTTPKITKGHAHLDVGALASPTKMDNGWMRADAYLTRSGVFGYTNPDGTKRREYRPQDEVFHADSMGTLRQLPITDDHPPKLLDASNTSDHAKGSLGETIRRDGDKLAASMLITDSVLAKKLERGDAQQVSCGYVCDLEWSPGVTPQGERYDAIQRNIRYNHAAVLPRGRAGSEVRVRMDAAENDVVLIPSPAAPTEQEPPMKIVRVDGIDYPADSDALTQALTKQEEKTRADAAAKDKQIADLVLANKTQGERLDAAIKDVDKLKKDATEAPAKIRADLEARASLEGKARKVLGSKVKLDGVDAKDVQLKVIAKLSPKSKMDGKTDEQIDARFDSEIERFDASSEEVETTTDVDPAERSDGADDVDTGATRLDADTERAKNIKGSVELWKRPIGASLSEHGRGLKITRS